MCRAVVALLLLSLAACAPGERDDSARAWQRAECNHVVDREDRARCIRRVEDDYPAGKREVDSMRKK